MTVGSKSQTAKTPLVCHGQSNPEEISTCYESRCAIHSSTSQKTGNHHLECFCFLYMVYLKLLGPSSRVSYSQDRENSKGMSKNEWLLSLIERFNSTTNT
jgi:hypothetical protein